MKAITCITKLLLKWFKSMSMLCRLQLRANLPGVDAGPYLLGKEREFGDKLGLYMPNHFNY